MKKLLLVCLMLFLNYSNSTAQNENYHRLLEEEASWRIGHLSCGWYVTNLQVSEYDTLINGQIYHRIEEYDSYSESLMKTYYMREDVSSQKVYEYNESLQTEFLIYDFGVQVGQTFSLQKIIPWQNASIDLPHVVNEIDAIQLENGEWRTRIQLTRLATTVETSAGDIWDFSEEYNYAWIEGVGCDMLPVASYFPDYWSSTLFCHQRRGQLMMENSEWGSYCDGFANTINPNNEINADENDIWETVFEDLVDISPNPASIAWNVQIVQDMKTPVVLQLFDIKGQLLKSISALNEKKIQIENEQLPAGIYFLKIMQNGKTLGSLKLQKQ